MERAQIKQWINRLTSGALIRYPLTVEARPRGTGDTWTPIPVSSALITHDEATAPNSTATLTLAGPAPAGMLDPTMQLWEVRITLGVSTATVSAAEQNAILLITDVSTDDGVITLTCESDEAPTEQTYIDPAQSEAFPTSETTLGQIWDTLAPKIAVMTPLSVKDAAVIPASALTQVRAQPYGGGDAPLDYLRAVADVAGLWVHSDQGPDSTGGLIADKRPTIKSETALDLRSTITPSLVIHQATNTGLRGDYAAAILLTCTWTQGVTRYESSGIIPAASAAARTQTVKRVALAMRPPSGQRSRITAAWPVAFALANRVAARTWEARIICPIMPWIRPGDTARTDKGYGLVRRLEINPSLGTMTVLVRPA